MGNNHSHDTKGGVQVQQSGSGTSTPRGSQRGAGSRSGSGGDLQGLAEAKEKAPLSMVPVEKLGKVRKDVYVHLISEGQLQGYIDVSCSMFVLIRVDNDHIGKSSTFDRFGLDR